MKMRPLPKNSNCFSHTKIKTHKYNFKKGLSYYNNYFLLLTIIIANIIL